VRTLPEDVRGAALSALADHGRPGGLSATAALINAVEAASLLGDPAGDAARNFASAAISSSLMEPTDRVSDYLRAVQAIRATPLRYLALEEMGVLCRGDDGESPIECMSVLPPGPERDAFLRSPATSLTLDPAEREQLLAAISDPALAAELRRKVEDMLEKTRERRESE
jgi:DNA-binding transcriptional ArsR family regulator